MIISALFAILGIDKMDFNKDGYPGPSAALLFELWERSNEVYLKIWYRKSDGTLCDVLEGSGRKDLTWNQLKNISSDYILLQSPQKVRKTLKKWHFYIVKGKYS